MYSREARFDKVDPKASPEQLAIAVGQLTDKLNTELSRIEQTVNPQGKTATYIVKGMDDKPITLNFRNGLLI